MKTTFGEIKHRYGLGLWNDLVALLGIALALGRSSRIFV
jgi:hypothetical protein